MSAEVQHEIFTDAAGVVRVDGVEEDLAAAVDRFAAEAALTGAPVVFRTADAGAEPVCFQVDAEGLVTMLDEAPATGSASTAVDPDPVAVEAGIPDGPAVAAAGGSEAPAAAGNHSPLDEAPPDSSSTGTAAAPSPMRLPGGVRRWLLIGAGVVAAGAIAAGTTWWITGAAATPPVAPKPVASSTTPAAPVTLPGWSRTPAWSAKSIDAAAAFGRHVIGLSGQAATVWEAGTGRKVSTATLGGTGCQVLAGDVETDAALAAVSDSQALVWVDGQSTPLMIDLTGGRTLQTRSGTFFVAGADRSFWMVTKTGEVPVTAPAAQLIVLGGSPGQILWATGAGHVIAASPNGTVLTDAALAAPAAGATVTPKTGWLRAAGPNVTVVGWTLPDGQTVTGIHNTSTGALLGTVPGTGSGMLQPGRGEWVTDGVRISLVDGKTTPLPEGFIPQTYLGGALLGAIASGGDALLEAGKSTPTPVTGSTVHPITATDMPPVLISLTGGQLAAFPVATAKK